MTQVRAKSHALPQVTKSMISSDAEASLSLVVYAPGTRQHPHSHPQPSLAMLLCGSLSEATSAGSVNVDRPSIGFKPPGVRHSTNFGDGATVLLSLSVSDPALWAVCQAEDWRWRPADVHVRQLLASAADRQSSWEDTVAELLAMQVRRPRSASRPPAWLCRAREELRDAPDTPLAALADRAGVHRVHLSRSFSRWFGEPLTIFRLRRTELAVAGVLHQCQSPAAAAAGAGFADQSHLSRSVRKLLGTTLRQMSAP